MRALQTARRLMVGAQRASRHGDAASALELALTAAQFLRLAREIDRMDKVTPEEAERAKAAG